MDVPMETYIHVYDLSVTTNVVQPFIISTYLIEEVSKPTDHRSLKRLIITTASLHLLRATRHAFDPSTR